MKASISQWGRTALAVMCLGVLSGCSTFNSRQETPPPSTPEVHRQHLLRIAGIDGFGIQGRIGVQANGKGFSGSTSWRHTEEIDSIAIFSPLGAQVATIDKNPESVILVADGKTYQADDIENLTQQHLGWRLPMAGLPDWILGRPNPRSTVTSAQWDHMGRLTRLQQDDWDIEFNQYVAASGYQLPQKIALRSKGLNIKLVVERWVIAEHTP